VIALDTHVVIWLHAGKISLLSEKVRQRLEKERPVICPLVALEIEYLHEFHRIIYPADTILGDLSVEIGLEICSRPFWPSIRESLKQKWTRNPFDRIITSHALVNQFDLASKDGPILENCSRAIWD